MTEIKETEALSRYYEELTTCLRLAGFEVQPASNGKLDIAFHGAQLCAASDVGVTYRRENLNSDERSDAKDQVYEIVCKTNEYMNELEHAPVLKAASLDEKYRLLIDYNGTALAAKTSNRGVQFVTWDWDLNHTSLNHGHYFGNDYEGAKLDFAIRAGLTEHTPLFSSEQLSAIHQCCEEVVHGTYERGSQHYETLRSVIDTIQDRAPEVCAQRQDVSGVDLDDVETEIEIMWDDLKPTTQQRILRMLGDNGNFDSFPIAIIQSGPEMEPTM